MNVLDLFHSYAGNSVSTMLETEEINVLSSICSMDHLEKSNQTRRWVRDNCAIYQHPEIPLYLDEPLQRSQGKIQDEAVRSTLYHILFEDYLEHNEHGVINYSIYNDSDVWVYVSVSDEPIPNIPYGSYGPLPKGTEYRSYQSNQLRFLETRNIMPT